MLQAIRDRASGWIAYIVIILIAIPFALWGVHRYLGGGGKQVAARVNDTEIPVQAYRNQLLRQKERLRSAFGGRLPDSVVDDNRLKENAIQSLVQQRVMTQTAKAAGLRISDRSLVQELSSLEPFQVEGEFDVGRYERVLKAQRMSKAQFESNVRRSMQVRQLRSGLSQSAFVPPAQARDYRRLQAQQRDIAYLTVPVAAFRGEIQVSEEAVEAYYNEHRQQFMQPEAVRLAYVELSIEGIAKRLSVTRDELREYYRQHADSYVQPEERKARTILIKLAEDANQGAVAKARERARSLKQELEAGASFAQLARQHSEDSLSAEQGGDLGYIARGDMGAAFEKALFQLQEGEVSQPVRTDAGIQLIELEEIRAAEQQPFEAVRDQVEEELRRRRAETRFVELTERLLTRSFENPETLSVAAEAVGAEVQTSDWITPEEGAGIGRQKAVREAAFSEQVLQRRQNSDLIELGNDRALVLRVREHREAERKPLPQVRNEVAARIKDREARKKAEALAEELAQRARDGASLQALADDTRAELADPGAVGRDASGIAQPILDQAFRMPEPGAGSRSPTVARTRLSNGDSVVVALREIQEPEVGGDGAPQELSQAYAQRELEAARRALVASADVKIFRDNL